MSANDPYSREQAHAMRVITDLLDGHPNLPRLDWHFHDDRTHHAAGIVLPHHGDMIRVVREWAAMLGTKTFWVDVDGARSTNRPPGTVAWIGARAEIDGVEVEVSARVTTSGTEVDR